MSAFETITMLIPSRHRFFNARSTNMSFQESL